ncbi:MAG: hypothetical protein GY793_07330 [Proteobacteria bacterium]|nr:hypothetical protein [Pseudomonadota bacterium]
MTQVNIYTIIAVAIYVLIIAYISYTSSRKETATDYIIGGRKVGTIGTMSSLIVSNFDGTGLVIILTFAILYGFGCTGLLFGYCLGYLFLAFFAKKIYSISSRGKYVTVTDMFKDRLGKKSARIITSVILFIYAFAIAGQLYISGRLLSAFFGIEIQAIGIILVALVVGLYLISGGYLTVIKTDVFQWFAVLGVGIAALIFGDFNVIAPRIANDFIVVDKELFWGLFTWAAFAIVASPPTWQRFFSAKSEKVIKKGALLTIPCFAFFMLSVIVFALSIHSQHPEIDAQNFAFEIYSNPNILPIVGPFLAVALLAMLMSTVDTFGYMVSSTIATNVLKIDHEKEMAKFVKSTKLITLVLFTSMTLVAIFISDFVEFMLNTYSIANMLFPAYMLILLTDGKSKFLDNLVFFSFLIGLAIWIYMFTTNSFKGSFMLMQIPLFISTGISGIVFLIYKIFKKGKIDCNT